MGFTESTTKVLMGVVNITFGLLGLALIIIGGLVLTDTNDYTDFIEHGFFSIPALLMIVGSIVALVFCFGGFAAFKKSYCMMMLFTGVIGLVLILEVGGIIAASLLRGKTEEFFQTSLRQNFQSLANDTSNQDLWNRLQTQLGCCGADSFYDYETLLKKPVPESCCIAPNCTTTDTTKIYTEGCGVELKKILVDNASLMIEWTAIVAVIHFIWVCMGCYLSKRFRTGGYESV